MKAVQMTLEEELVAQVDRLVHKLKTARSAFARDGESKRESKRGRS